MDLFGRKAKAQIAKLERENDNLSRGAEQLLREQSVLRNTLDATIKTLRDQDQLIWTMGQQPSWERMRPHFNQLQSATESRMRLESDRIRDVLIPEIRKAYNATPSNQIEHK